MRTSNPVFRSLENTQSYETTGDVASYGGITAKTLTLLLTAVASGFLFLYAVYTGAIGIESVFGFLIGSMIVGFIAVIMSRNVRFAMIAGIVYAFAEGILLGTITALAELYAPGIAFTALIGTVAVFTVMLFLYSSRIIRVTTRFRKIVVGALISVIVTMVIFWIISIVAPTFVQTFYSPGLALLVTGILIILGAFMLTLDFERAEAIVSGGYEKRYEWVVSIGLMVTIVWLYIEILRFLLILASRNR